MGNQTTAFLVGTKVLLNKHRNYFLDQSFQVHKSGYYIVLTMPLVSVLNMGELIHRAL